MARPHYDWIVVGSGFGGSVAALRLAEKGYSVAVLECGRRFEDSDFAESAWNLRRYCWMPKLGMRGIFRMSVFKDVFIASGNGVGGGSLGYANTLYRARPAFFTDRQWDGLADWAAELEPHYGTAERMLGVAEVEGMTPADELLREYGEEIGVGDTFAHTRVGVFFGPPGEQVSDPYFGGEGPARTGCLQLRLVHARLSPRRQEHAGQELPLVRREARRRRDPRTAGDRDPPPRRAPTGPRATSSTTEHPGAWLRKRRRRFTAGGVVVAAGALGTNQLLADCKHGGALPRISDRLGEVVRTNTESIQAVTAPDDEP